MAESFTLNEIEQDIKRLIKFGSVDDGIKPNGPNTDTKTYLNTDSQSKHEGYQNEDNIKSAHRKKKNKWSKSKHQEGDGHGQAPADHSNILTDHHGFGEACETGFVKDQNAHKRKRNKRNKKKAANQNKGDETSENDDGLHVDISQSECPSVLENNNNSRTDGESGGYMQDKVVLDNKNVAGKDSRLVEGAERSREGIESSYVLEELKITTHTAESKFEHGKCDNVRRVVKQKNKKDPVEKCKDQQHKIQEKTVGDKNYESGNVSNEKKQNNNKQRHSNAEIYQHPHSRLRQDEISLRPGSDRNRNPRQDKSQQSEPNERGNFNSKNRERYDINSSGNKKAVQKFWDTPVKKGKRKKTKQENEDATGDVSISVVGQKAKSNNSEHDVVKELEKDMIFPLKKKSTRFIHAKFFCRLCEYHMDQVEDCKKHMKDSRHARRLEVKIIQKKLKKMPSPSEQQMKALDQVIKNIAEEHGLSEEDVQYRKKFTEDLEKMLQSHIPDISLCLYGSSLTGVGLKESDVNIDLVVPDSLSAAKGLTLVFKLMKESDKYEEVRSDFSAKIPSVYFTDPERNMNCQLTINSVLAYKTSQLLSIYTRIDPRVVQLSVALRHWARICKVDRQEEGTLPSYCLALMTIYYLQQRKPSVLPILMACEKTTATASKKNQVIKVDFDQLNQIADKWQTDNTETIGSLWLGLLKFYSLDFDCSTHVICVRQLERLSRAERKWNSKRVAVEDPFSNKRNVARCVTSFLVFEYIWDCLRKAYYYFGLPTNYGSLTNEEKQHLKTLSAQSKQESKENSKGNKKIEEREKVEGTETSKKMHKTFVECVENEDLKMSDSDSDCDNDEIDIFKKVRKEGNSELKKNSDETEIMEDDCSVSDADNTTDSILERNLNMRMIMMDEILKLTEGQRDANCDSDKNDIPVNSDLTQSAETNSDKMHSEISNIDKIYSENEMSDIKTFAKEIVTNAITSALKSISLNQSESKIIPPKCDDKVCEITNVDCENHVSTGDEINEKNNVNDTECVDSLSDKVPVLDAEIKDDSLNTSVQKSAVKNSQTKYHEVQNDASNATSDGVKLQCLENSQQNGPVSHEEQGKSRTLDSDNLTNGKTDGTCEEKSNSQSVPTLKYDYCFSEDYFTDGKGPAIICCICDREGHLKHNCPEEHLPELEPLPPMRNRHLQILTDLLRQVPRDFGPSEAEYKDREKTRFELEGFVQELYPDARLDLFGSSYNGFGFKQSDMDLCLTFKGVDNTEDMDVVAIIEELTKKLKTHKGLYNVFPITTAKVPIVKFKHRRSQLEGDISLYNLLALHNTRLVRLYSSLDSRVKVLGYALKVFAKICDIGDASRGSLSSYAYILMALYYLQQCKPPVIPVLQELYAGPNKPQFMVESWNTWYFEKVDKLHEVWPDYGKNKMSVGELWVGLFRFYTEEFNFRDYTICIRQLEPLTRFEKLWNGKCLAIEDPFDLNHNLGSGLSRKMNQFIIKAFIRGRYLYGSPIDNIPQSYRSAPDYFFDPAKLTEGMPPNDRCCRVCNKIGHIAKECPIVTNRKEREEREKKEREEKQRRQQRTEEFNRQDRRTEDFNRQERRTEEFNRQERRTEDFNRQERRTEDFNRQERRTEEFNRQDRRTEDFNRQDRRTEGFNRQEGRTEDFNRQERRTEDFNRQERRTEVFNRQERRTEDFNRQQEQAQRGRRTVSESSSHSIEDTQQKPFQRQYFYSSTHRSNSVPSSHNGQDRPLQYPPSSASQLPVHLSHDHYRQGNNLSNQNQPHQFSQPPPLMSLQTPRFTGNISPSKQMRHGCSTGQVSTTSHHQFQQQQQQQQPQQHAHPWIHQFMQTNPQQHSHQQHGQQLPQQAPSLPQHEMVSQHILGSSPSSQSNTGVSTNSFYIPAVNIPSSLSVSSPSTSMMSPASLLSAQYGLVQPMVYQTSASQQQIVNHNSGRTQGRPITRENSAPGYLGNKGGNIGITVPNQYYRGQKQ